MGRLVAMWGVFAIALAVAAPVEAALRWSKPESIAPDVGNVRVAMDARGDALATWFDGAGALKYSWRAPRGSWTPPKSLGPAGGSQLPAMALTPRGRATIAWSAGSRIVVASSGPGGTFRSRGTIDALPGGQVTAVDIATDDAGELVIAWAEAGQDVIADYSVRTVIRGPGGRLGAPQTVSTERVSGLFDVAMNPAGAAVVSWTNGRTPSSPRATYRPPGGSFGSEEVVPLPESSSNVTVAIDQAGVAYATSSSFSPTFPVPSGGTSLTVRSPLGGWSDAAALDPGGLIQQVIAEPTGAVSFFVERDDGQGGREEALTSRLPDGSQAGPAAISSPDSAGVRVATDLAGNMLGTWTRHPDGQARGSSIVVAERPRTGVFGSERLLSPTDSIGSDAALTDGGQAVVAWLHARESGNLGSGEIQARVREDRSLPVLPFPPDVDIDAPADPALAANGTLKVPVQCSRRCKVSASGLLFTDGTPRALAPRGATHKLRGKRRRGRVTLVFPADAATAARAAGRAVVAISVRARGRSPRPVIFSRQITLKR